MQSMITKTLVRQGNVGDKVGYCFEVYYNNREYPNIISSLAKTEIGAKAQLTRFLKTGKFSLYGNAEQLPTK